MRGAKRFSLVALAATAAVLGVAGIAWAATINGTAVANTLDGTAAADTINGLGGNDTVYGLEGNDRIDGGEGSDVLYGAEESQYYPGADYILGQSGDDKIFGGPEADRMHGGYGRDSIWEGPPDDEAPDTITGGPDSDLIYAASGVEEVKDTIQCNDGQDQVWADAADSVAADCEVVNRQPAEASVAFTRQVQVETVTQMTAQYDSKITSLESDFSVAGEYNHQGIENPTQTDPAQLKQALEANQLAYFEDSVSDIEDLPAAWREDVQPQYNAMNAALAANDVGTPTVSEVTVSGELPALRALASESRTITEDGEAVIESVEVSDPSEPLPPEIDPETITESEKPLADPNSPVSDGPEADPAQPPTNPDGTANLEARSTWYPNQGTSFVRDSFRPGLQGQRYSGQWFSWDNNQLGFGDGYEHSLNIEFSDRKSYLNGSVSFGNCFPKNLYWSENFPIGAGSYRDDNLQPTTRNPFRCDTAYRTFTIGITQGYRIQDGKRYHTYMRVPKGRVNTDAASLEASRTGHYYKLNGQVIPGQCTPLHLPLPNFCWFGRASRILIDPQGAGSLVDLHKIPYSNPSAGRAWTEWTGQD